LSIGEFTHPQPLSAAQRGEVEQEAFSLTLFPRSEERVDKRSDVGVSNYDRAITTRYLQIQFCKAFSIH
jgi:hypothetical protein